MRDEKSYIDVTETPGGGASEEQLSMLLTRYNLATKFSENKLVLEIACGSGTGLSYLASKAKFLYACDIDPDLVLIAKNNVGKSNNIVVTEADAHKLPYTDANFDTIVFFEAIYYISDINLFISEILRVLKSNGVIVISTVNCEWHGFNPSPFSVKYYSASELLNLFSSSFVREKSIYFGYKNKVTYKNFLSSLFKILAVKLKLMPKTMGGKRLLKRLFMGKLRPIPKDINEGIAHIEPLVLGDKITSNEIKNYKQIYLITKKI